MSIKRGPLPAVDHFTITPNARVRDGNLSLRARGLLTLLLSHRVGWEITIDSLVRENPEGRDAIRKAVRELEQRGYLHRQRLREGTKLAGIEYTLTEPPISSVGFPYVGPAYVGKSPTKKTSSSEDHLSEDEIPSAGAAGAPPAEEPRPEIEQLCVMLADRIEANGSKRPEISKAWRDSARLLLDRDGRTPQQVAWIIGWCQSDEFWRSNILSMPTLRKQFDRLRLRAQHETGPAVSRRERENQAFLTGAGAGDQGQSPLELTSGWEGQ